MCHSPTDALALVAQEALTRYLADVILRAASESGVELLVSATSVLEILDARP